MCGRYYLNVTDKLLKVIHCFFNEMRSLHGEIETVEIMPGNTAPVYVMRGGACIAEKMKWGFNVKNGSLVINARCETLYERIMYSNICDSQRCVIPASGYYKWRRGDGQKFSFSSATNELMYLCGIYRYFEDEAQFVVVTRSASDGVSKIHNRMPMIVQDKDHAMRWLKGEAASAFMSEGNELYIRACGDEQLKMPF